MLSPNNRPAVPPKGETSLGNTRQFARDPLAFMEACRDAYGDLAWFSLGPYEGVLLTGPADIEQVLVSEADNYRKPTYMRALTDTIGEGLVLGNGPNWRAQRERAQTLFSLSRIESFVETIARYAAETADSWTPGETIDVHREMGTLTIRTFGEMDISGGRAVPGFWVRTPTDGGTICTMKTQLGQPPPPVVEL